MRSTPSCFTASRRRVLHNVDGEGVRQHAVATNLAVDRQQELAHSRRQALVAGLREPALLHATAATRAATLDSSPCRSVPLTRQPPHRMCLRSLSVKFEGVSAFSGMA